MSLNPTDIWYGGRAGLHQYGDVILKKAQLVGILERLGQELEPTQSQYDTAKDHYEAVGNWLAASGDPILKSVSIYPQGSVSLQTVTKPLANDEYDVDLVCHAPNLHPDGLQPDYLKKLIGVRLKENGRYTDLIEEKQRCWRINYANQFHLDITPSIPNPGCTNGGELVPDKRLRQWKATNPKGYRDQFTTRAALRPRLQLLEKAELSEMRAQVEALPDPARFKGILRRTVQLLKRHRDVWFSGQLADLTPISVIITTLAARSYEYCVYHGVYDTELDVFLDVIRHMPDFIEIRLVYGRRMYYVWNETTDGENFAEKWNQQPELAQAFYTWQQEALEEFSRLPEVIGRDQLQAALTKSFGERASRNAMTASTTAISTSRQGGLLSLAPSAGLLSTTAHGLVVRPNTFFGASEGGQ